MGAPSASAARRVTSIKWAESVDARLRILVNLAAEELGRPTSAAELLAGLIVREPLNGKRAAKTAQAATARKLRDVERENAEHIAQAGPHRGRPRGSAVAEE